MIGLLPEQNVLLNEFLKKEFVPSQDQSRFLVRIILPLGTSLETTNELFKKAEAELMQHVLEELGLVWSEVAFGFLLQNVEHVDRVPA